MTARQWTGNTVTDHGAQPSGLARFAPCASPRKTESATFGVCLPDRNGDWTHKPGVISAHAQAERIRPVDRTVECGGAQIRAPNQITVRRTFVLHRVDGEWQGYVPNVRGTYLRAVGAEDLDHPGELTWSWIPVRKDWGYVTFRWECEVARCVGAAQSPIWTAMWDIVRATATRDIVGTSATARPLSRAELEEERRLLSSDRANDSCVYLSLFHLAKRRTTKDWLLDLDGWGPCEVDRIHELCRGWVAREQRTLRYSEVRKERQNSTGASDVIVRIFRPTGVDDTDHATLLVLRVSPSGYAPRGHAVPVDGRLEVREFGFPPELAYAGRCPEAAVEVVMPQARKQQPEPDEPAPKINPDKKQKRRERVWRVVDKAAMDDIDKAFELALDRSRGNATSSATDAVVDAVLEEASAEAVVKPGPRCIDCNDPFETEDSPASRCKACKKAWQERRAEALDKTAPVSPPPVVQRTPEEKQFRGGGADAGKVEPVQPREDRIEPGVGCQTGQPDSEAMTQTTPVERLRWIFRAEPVFEGCVQQLPIKVAWRCGWWKYEDQEYCCGDWAKASIPIVGRPDLCSATLEYVDKWSTFPYYVPVYARDGLQFTANGVITDGAKKTQTFKEGSVIKVRGQHLVARRVAMLIQGCEVDLLKLEKRDSGSLKSMVCGRYFIGTPKLVSYEPDCSGVDKGMKNACKWQGAVKTEKDPLVQGFIQIARVNENGKKRPADPDHVVPFLRQLADTYERPEDVSGPFKWGYCYGGCGKERPGKFHGRICPACEKENSVLGKWVAAGYRVCTDLNPVRYPGVVSLSKEHPPLKKDAKTTAVYGQEYGVYRRDGSGKLELVPEKEWQEKPLKDTRGPRLGGIGLDGLRVFVTAPGTRPLVEAIKFRVFKDLGDRTVDVKAFQRITALLDSFLPMLTRQEVVKRRDGLFLDMLEWVNTMNCGRRKRALMKALLELRSNGWIAPHDWDVIKPFVKTENLPYFKARKDWQLGTVVEMNAFEYVPRLIQAPSDYSHLVAGPYLKPMIYGLKEDWGPENWIFYGSVDPIKLDQWLQNIKGCRSFFWSDYTAFDATYSPEAWQMIETLYKRCMPEASAEFWRVIEAWRTPRGVVTLRSDGYTVKYFARVCNCSGRDDTALANALLNGLVLGASFAAAIAGVDLLELQPQHIEAAKGLVRISVVGDDSLVGCDFDVTSIKDQVLANIKRFGLVAKVATSDWIGDVTYLGMMPYPVGTTGELQWGPTIGRRLYKAFWQADPVGSLPAWTRGVAQQLLLCRNVPILYEAAQQVDFLLRGHKITRQVVDKNRVWASRTSETKAQSPDAYQWLVRRYGGTGLTVEMIAEDIGRIRSIQRLPAIVKLESVERMLQIDDV